MSDVLGLMYSSYFFLFTGTKRFRKHQRTRRVSDEEIKKQLINSIVNNDIIERKELKEKTDKLEKPEDAAVVIKQYEDIIRTKKKNIISIAYYRRKVLKQFKDKEKFIKLVNEFKVHRSTIIFKINIFNLIDRHLKLMKSSRTLGFLKNYYRNIKQICKENSNKFE